MPFPQQVKAGGDINPARFVSLSTSEDFTVLESNAGDEPVIGICGEDTKNAPQTGGSSLHAEDEDHVRVFSIGDNPLLELGGTVTRGDYIKPDADGKGVTASTADDVAYAQALESGVSGELISVWICGPHRIHA